MSAESVRARGLFQQFLDEEFPEGGRVIRLVLMEGRWVPVLDMLTARLFASDVAIGEDGDWIYEITVDPNPPGTDAVEEGRPWVVWTEGLFLAEGVEHELWEGVVTTSRGEELEERVRVVPGLSHLSLVDGLGDPLSPERMREWLTERWMPRLFPAGLEVA